MRRTYSLFVIALFICSNAMSQLNVMKLISPDKRTSLQLERNKDGKLCFSIAKNGEVLINPSVLGICINGHDYGLNTVIGKMSKQTVNEIFPVLGDKKSANYTAIRYKILFEEHENNQPWVLECDVSNEGVAFRYIIGENRMNHVNIENTTFTICDHTKVWFFERNNDWKLKSYAGEWKSCNIRELNGISALSPVQGCPLILEFKNNSFGLITEAALYNYSGVRWETIGTNTIKANFPEGEKGFDVQGTITTPWRVCLLADNLNDLVNNNLIYGLNPAPDKTLFADTDWIKPGRSVWRWWSRGTGNPTEEKEIIESGSLLGFEYSLIDEGWEKWDNKWSDLKDLCNYGKSKNIGIWVWKHSDELNSPENGYKKMRLFLDSLKNAGVCGVKVDFMNGESKTIIDFDIALLRLAAERKLMVNLHGCQKPSGEARTYPNELTREGIRGLELNLMNEGPIPPDHNAALPFTRMVVGNGDYTPLGFTSPGKTTWAHQIATLVCFRSPLQCIAEDPLFLLNNAMIHPALEMIKAIPAVWDQTIVLSGSKIGDVAIIARRNGMDWFVGVLNGPGAKEIRIPFSFLPKGAHQIKIIQDDTDAKLVDLRGLSPKAKLKESPFAVPFKVSQKNVLSTDTMTMNLINGGGLLIYFSNK